MIRRREDRESRHIFHYGMGGGRQREGPAVPFLASIVRQAN